MKVTVPGNLLLLGEYAVLEEGGLGLALAVEPRVMLEIRPSGPGGAGRPAAGGLLIEGSWGAAAVRWPEAGPGGAPLFEAVVAACGEALRARGRSAADAAAAGGAITVDSSTLFPRASRKSGLGSSAAVAVGLAWAILYLCGLDGAELAGAALEAALNGHRRFQGGRGSGYDVFASFHGGCGLFTGGRLPRWQPCRLDWLPALRLLPGPRSVSTVSSVARYEDWKRRHAAAAADFLRRSNSHVLGFARASSWPEAAEHFRRAADLGIRLGEAIGVDARPGGSEGSVPAKSLGAGNELAVQPVVPGDDTTAEDTGGNLLKLSAEGVRSEGPDLP